MPATNSDFFKRTVLAAEIIDQLKDENTLGHLKLQKLMYLCQHTTRMNLQTNFLKQAMGPYNPRLMRSIDKQMKIKNWFEFAKDKFPKYQPLENAGEHTQWYNRYFTHQKSQIDSIINIFRTAKSHQVELVATIYACCLESKKNKEIISKVTIVNKVYAWSKDKEKFSEQQITSAHTWMQEKGIYPT